MTGFILAAGFGKRLRPLTDHLPKALVPVGGEPLLAWALRRMAGAAPARMLVNTHYQAAAIAAYGETSPIGFEISHEPEIRGTGGALYTAREALALDATFCVSNADILAPLDLAAMHQRFLASGAMVGLLADTRKPRGTIYFVPDSHAYAGVPADGPQPPGTAPADFIGIAFYRREFLDLLRPDDFSVVPVWRRALAAGHGVSVLSSGDSYWRDLGTPRSLLDAHLDLLHQRLALPRAPRELTLDTKLHRCWPAGGSPDGVGPESWVEAPLPAGTLAEHCLILRDARPRPGATYRDCILTPWGEIRLDP